MGLTGSLLVPGWYFLAATLVGLAAMTLMRETAPTVAPAVRLTTHRRLP
jgi:hypothetical protein